MAIDASLDPLRAENARMSGAARNFYTLANSDLGAKELPRGYSRALRIRLGTSAVLPLVMVVVPVEEANDATTQTITIDATTILPFGVRRIVSLNSGTTVPTGVEIQVITK